MSGDGRAVSFPPTDLPPAVREFLAERHLGTLSVVRSDGRVHVSPVGFSFDPETATARVITSATARKAIHAASAGRISLCQVDGARWLTLEGPVRITATPDEVAEGERRYAARYRDPRPNPQRVVLVVSIDRMYGRVA